MWRGGWRKTQAHEKSEDDSMQDVDGSECPQGMAATPGTSSSSTVRLRESMASTVPFGCSLKLEVAAASRQDVTLSVFVSQWVCWRHVVVL